MPSTYRIILAKDVAEDAEVLEACKLFNVPVSVTDDISGSPDNVLSIYVLNSFDKVETNGTNYKLLGRTAFLEVAKKRQEAGEEYFPFPSLAKPLYCHALSGKVICFAGFKKKEELLALRLLIHHMGGSVRKDLDEQFKVTHLIAKLYGGEKCHYAVTFNIPIMSENWIYDAWQNRNLVGFDAGDSDFISKYKLKPFHGSRICFLGYPKEEENHMIDVLRENGGEPTDLTDPTCTHLVMEKSSNAFRVLSMISYSNKRFIQSTNPSSVHSGKEDTMAVPSKKIKFDPENAENINPDWDEMEVSECEIPYKPLSVLGESSGPKTRAAKKRRSTASSHVGLMKGLFEIANTPSPCSSESSPKGGDLDPFVERLPSKRIVFDTDAANIHFDTPPGIPNIFNFSPDPPNLSVDSIREPMLPNQDVTAICDTVVDETKISAAPPMKSKKTFIVKAEWFWTSVQHEGRVKENDFIFENYCYSGTPQSLNTTPVYAHSSKKSCKRKIIIKDNGYSSQKRKSSASDITRTSEGSFLDYTNSPHFVDGVESPSQDKTKKTRYDTFLELCQTERNYVGILNTIMTLFKESLEKMVDTENELLNATELKIIFGHLPPIYAAHNGMLSELEEMGETWNDDSSIGQLILKYSDDLNKAYPPFTNFFLNIREMLIKCDKTKPRFHAFLKICQSKPECGRQSLQDLLIRPVQRLPSIILLLNKILKHTSKSSADYSALEKAIVSLEDIMNNMNEARRKIESQVALFDIFNKIENCPAHIVSSQRCFISRCEVMELNGNLSGRGDPLVLFLFSDVIEICKKRKAFNNQKSPKENSSSVGSRNGTIKLYKHVKLLPLNSILKVIDIKETEDCHNIFALRINQELKDPKEKTYSFTITDETIEKTSFLHTLCKQIANIVCRTDTDNCLMYLEAQQLDIDSSEVTTGTLGRAFNKFATKTRIKVGRALSFNKTPKKLKRAVSTMMSPFGNQSGLTPSTQLSNLQLAALPNIPVTMRM